MSEKSTSTRIDQNVGLLVVVDLCAWVIAIFAALGLRFDFYIPRVQPVTTFLLIALVLLLQLGVGWITWLYRKRYMIASFDEVRALVLNVTTVALVSWLLAFLFAHGNGIPRSTMIMAAPIACSMMGAMRYVIRLYQEKQIKTKPQAERALIYGAGYAGSTAAKRLLTDKSTRLLPVAFLDDSENQCNKEVSGVRVLGTFADIERVVAKTGATRIIVCIGDADAVLLRRVKDKADELGLQVMVMPPVEQILRHRSAFEDVHELSIEDLIGRTPVRLNNQAIFEYVRGKRVLVTGAGGSIGSELCRQLTFFEPAEIIMLDRDETGLQTVQLSVKGNGLLDGSEVVLADIRDANSIDRIFQRRRPHVVFHAAALKHLPMLEQYPDEAWKTNVLGTLNVLEAARRAEVGVFVNISTDKAANPTSVLGHSKRVAEKLTAWMSEQTNGRYLSVRFGNVLGSRGSMLPTFRRLIAQGGPVTVTHPEATRFFMTIPEACQLVLQAGSIGRPGEVMILDMGEPVRILDIAKQMIAQSGKEIEIVFTGLRHGEKLHEELVALGEGDERPFHPKISHAKVAALSPSVLDYRGWLHRLNLTERAQTYTSYEVSEVEFSPTQPVCLPRAVTKAARTSSVAAPSATALHSDSSSVSTGGTSASAEHSASQGAVAEPQPVADSATSPTASTSASAHTLSTQVEQGAVASQQAAPPASAPQPSAPHNPQEDDCA